MLNLEQLHQLIVGQLFNGKIEIFWQNMSLRGDWDRGCSARTPFCRRCRNISGRIGRESLAECFHVPSGNDVVAGLR
jgi:hypothetical protein